MSNRLSYACSPLHQKYFHGGAAESDCCMAACSTNRIERPRSVRTRSNRTRLAEAISESSPGDNREAFIVAPGHIKGTFILFPVDSEHCVSVTVFESFYMCLCS